MARVRASGVKTTDWYVQRGVGRRPNSNNYLAGQLSPKISQTNLESIRQLLLTLYRYAEVLENTQYALIATVQKLYTMVRNNEPWTLGEPQLNDRGLPVIHNIAEKLGCIRPSPDLPYAFPEDPQEFADLQNRLKTEEDEENNNNNKQPHESPTRPRRERASSSESDHSDISHDYKNLLYPQAPTLTLPLNQVPDFCRQSLVSESQFGDDSFYGDDFKATPTFDDPPLDFSLKDLSPVYTDFPATTANLDFGPDGWVASPDELMTNGGLDMASLQLRQAQAMQMQAALAASQGGAMGMGMSDGTIRPNLLDCRNRGSAGFDLADQMGGFMFTEFAGRV